MKKLTLLLLFFCLAVNAQVFPEKNYTLLKPGMKVAVNYHYEYTNFYEKGQHYKHYKEQGGRFTDPEAIKGRTFEIIEIIPDESNIDYYSLTLKDINNQEVISYRTSKRFDIHELRMLDTIELPADYFCDYVDYAAEGEITFVHYEGIRFLKYLDKGKPRFTLQIESESIKKTSNVGTITVIFKNGKQIIKKNVNTKQSLSMDGKTGSYEALLTLTAAEASLFKESEIDSFDFFSLNKQEPKPQITGVIKGAAACVIKN